MTSEHTVTSDLIGRRLGPYEITALVAAGERHEVFRGCHTQSQHEVIIHIVGRHDTGEAVPEAAFRREAQAIVSLHHPGIVPVYDFGRVDGGYYMVAEEVQGTSLADLIAEVRAGERSLPPDDITFIIRQVAAALNYAHRRGVVHRAVSPHTILITRSGQALLADFGLSLLYSQGEPQRAPFGRPEYTAPELLADAGAASPASDIYSLGVVLYELLTGQLPYVPESDLDAVMRTLTGSAPDPRLLNPDIPPAVAQVTLKALAQSPAERFPSALRFAEALERAYKPPAAVPRTARRRAKAPPTPSRATPDQQPRRRAASPPAIACLGRAVLILIIIALLGGALLALLRTLGVLSRPTPAAPQAETTLADVLPPSTATPALPPTLTPPLTPTPLQPAAATPVAPLALAALEVGSSAFRLTDGMVMLFIPAGPFLMGGADRYAAPDEQPQHTVVLSDFWLDRTEVTNAQYALCVADGVCPPPTNRRFFDDPLFARYPVIYVPHASAVTYCLWLAQESGAPIGLPTEAQWEKAASWDPLTETARVYPWGDEVPSGERLRYQGNTVIGIAPVGSLPAGASAYGVLDMAGNVWEWVADWYDAAAYQRSGIPVDPSGPPSGTHRVIRGGGWYDDFTQVRTSVRGQALPTAAANNIGFRCALNSRRPPTSSAIALTPLELAQGLASILSTTRADGANNPTVLDEWAAALDALVLALQNGDNQAGRALIDERLERLAEQEEAGLLSPTLARQLEEALHWMQQQPSLSAP